MLVEKVAGSRTTPSKINALVTEPLHEPLQKFLSD